MERVPILKDDLLWLDGDGFDLEDLLAAVKPLGLEPRLGKRFSLIESELKEIIVERGVSYLWRLTRLLEAVLPPGPAARPALLKTVEAMLARLSPTTSLTIVDPYLLHNSSPQQLSDLLFVMGSATAKVSELRLVTKSLGQSTVLTDLAATLLTAAPECRLRHSVTDRYHDRFWIVDESRGLFVGTSLNGIGNRYALVDYLDPNDVSQIVADLHQQGLL